MSRHPHSSLCVCVDSVSQHWHPYTVGFFYQLHYSLALLCRTLPRTFVIHTLFVCMTSNSFIIHSCVLDAVNKLRYSHSFFLCVGRFQTASLFILFTSRTLSISLDIHALSSLPSRSLSTSLGIHNPCSRVWRLSTSFVTHTVRVCWGWGLSTSLGIHTLSSLSSRRLSTSLGIHKRCSCVEGCQPVLSASTTLILCGEQLSTSLGSHTHYSLSTGRLSTSRGIRTHYSLSSGINQPW